MTKHVKMHIKLKMYPSAMSLERTVCVCVYMQTQYLVGMCVGTGTVYIGCVCAIQLDTGLCVCIQTHTQPIHPYLSSG